jgi:hypothetical protein
MTSYDKVIKLACKPKAAAPKAKVRIPLVQCATDVPDTFRVVFGSHYRRNLVGGRCCT